MREKEIVHGDVLEVGDASNSEVHFHPTVFELHHRHKRVTHMKEATTIEKGRVHTTASAWLQKKHIWKQATEACQIIFRVAQIYVVAGRTKKLVSCGLMKLVWHRLIRDIASGSLRNETCLALT